MSNSPDFRSLQRSCTCGEGRLAPKPLPGLTRIVGALFFGTTLLGTIFASACSTSGTLQTDDRSTARVGSGSTGASIEVPVTEEFLEIREFESSRSLGDGRLIALLGDGAEPAVRARAAQALGRMPFPDYGAVVTEPLCSALDDESAAVRAAAAFSLGLRADPQSAGVLLAFWRDPDALVRSRIIQAASQVDTPPIRTQVLRSMRDPDLGVRQAAIKGTANWDSTDPDAGEVDSALLSAMSPYPDRTKDQLGPDPEVIWCALFALQRRKSEKGRGAFLEHIDNPDARARIFAVRGLSRITPSKQGTRALLRAIKDIDWRVVCEAAFGLGESLEAGAVPPLLAAVDHPVSHVRARALEALRNFPGQTVEILPIAWRGNRDLSGTVRSAALGTLGRIMPGAETVTMLEKAAADRNPVVRAGAATAAAETLESFRAIPLLDRLAHDSNLFVATAAANGLKLHLTPRSRGILHELLNASDNGLRLSAVMALSHEDNAREGDVAALAGAIESSAGDIAPEVAFNSLRCLGKIGTEAARSAVVGALDYPDGFVRQVAREVLSSDFGQPKALTGGSPTVSGIALATSKIPRLTYPIRTRNPVVDIITSRGTMTFELLFAETPAHVESFLRLARNDHYDGLTFHRVVPNYVIQGGDYRGDGKGGMGTAGDSLGQEFSPRAYVRGSLGMPRNENPNSGGAQIFVTHRDTPHLDARYTLFGTLLSGGEVLDLIEVGDVIQDVLIFE